MDKKLLPLLIICIFTVILLFSILSYFSQSDSSDKIQEGTNNYSTTGKPCVSTEEWHNKADQIGFWADGVLVSSLIPDDEILQVLTSVKSTEFCQSSEAIWMSKLSFSF